MGMFSSKPPFDLTAFLAEKATTRPGSRRFPAKPRPAPAAEPEAEPEQD